jgi:cation diffusion facilitator family transporter
MKLPSPHRPGLAGFCPSRPRRGPCAWSARPTRPQGRHGHTHGVVDPTIATSDRGIWAIKWSFVILAITAALQFGVVVAAGSVAFLADTIHNVDDAVTAVPLWVAFRLARRKPSPRFTYGLGRVEDLAGVAIVGVILLSAIVAAWAVDRLIHPQPITLLWAVAAAGAAGFLGNEACAIFRIRVAREIESAALIADGYHARTDGLTSLAVVVGAVGVWLGFALTDPIIGLLITITIFGIVWQSAKAVFTACSTVLSRISWQISDVQRGMSWRFWASAPAGSGID